VADHAKPRQHPRWLAGRNRLRASNTATLLPVNPVDDGPVLLFDRQWRRAERPAGDQGRERPVAGSPEYQPNFFLGDCRGGSGPAPDDALPPLLLSAGALAAADFDIMAGSACHRRAHVARPVSAGPAQRLARKPRGQIRDATETSPRDCARLALVTPRCGVMPMAMAGPICSRSRMGAGEVFP